MIRAILYAIPLMLMWIAITGQDSIAGFIVGYIVSFSVLLLFLRHSTDTRIFKAPLALLRYIWQVARDLFVADLRVAGQIVTGKHIDSQTVTIPLANDSNLDDDFVAALSSHAITLTPGTLVIDIDEENNTLLLHRLDARDTPEKLADEQRERTRLIRGVFHD